MQPVAFGRYILLDLLARGGMGEVFIAIAGDAPRRAVALKKIRDEISRSRQFYQRFVEEVRVSVAMDHPNIVAVHEAGTVDGDLYLAMELVVGYDLAWVTRRQERHSKPAPVAASLYVARELAAALHYCHQYTDAAGAPIDLVHRDVAPANVLVSCEGQIKLADFGLALSAFKSTQTRPDLVMGKAGYLAPEQATGETLDHRIDIFSLGVLTFELLTAERFVTVFNPREHLKFLKARALVKPSSIRRDVPVEVDQIIGRALAIDPAGRYQSAGELHQALDGALRAIDPDFDADKLVQTSLAPLFDLERPRTRVRDLLDQPDIAQLLPLLDHASVGSIDDPAPPRRRPPPARVVKGTIEPGSDTLPDDDDFK